MPAYRGHPSSSRAPPQLLPRSSPDPPQILPRSFPDPSQIVPGSSLAPPQLLPSSSPAPPQLLPNSPPASRPPRQPAKQIVADKDYFTPIGGFQTQYIIIDTHIQ